MASQPQRDVKDIALTRLNRYERLQQLQQQFWSLWSRDYLTSLQVRTKWKTNPEEEGAIGVDTLVLLKDENNPPLRWSLARVVQLHEGNDHIVRVVSVRLPNGNIVKRSLARICPISIDN